MLVVLKTLLDEELSLTQRHLDSSGITMPNFMNIGSSLRRELNESDDEDDHCGFKPTFGFDSMLNNYGRTIQTPDLIIEEEESDSEFSHSSVTEDGKSIFDILTIKTHISVDYQSYWCQEENRDKLVTCQSIARTWLARKEFIFVKNAHRSNDFNNQIARIQAHIRGNSTRAEIAERKKILLSQEQFIIKLQCISRGCLARLKYQQTIDYYRAHIDKIIKVQTFVKNKLLGNAYKKLTTDSNPSISTVKSFIHLLDDSDLDFDRELALEDMRQQVIEHIRENNQLDSHINVLDIQIALFLKNAISIDEVLKHSGAFKKKKEQQRIMNHLADKNTRSNPFTFSSVDKDSRKRLELFQQLVYTLQTEPKYLARLLSMTNRQDLGVHSSHKLIESTVLSLFGYATNAREEFLLINLCKVFFFLVL